tara:strand:- start:2262 stop:3317 length:1056 start_codon:yes stop_codon:yes gene_type:complete
MKKTRIALGVNDRIQSQRFSSLDNIDFSGSTNWEHLGGENEEKFNIKLQNAKHNKNTLPRQYEELKSYKDYPIIYDYNNYGFRGEDLNTEDEYTVFLGCSHTSGIGHYYENTWPHQIMKDLDDGSKIANLALGGYGISSGYRNLLKMSEKIKIKRVFCFFPHWGRVDFCTTDDSSGEKNVQWDLYTSYNPSKYLIEQWGKVGFRKLQHYLNDYDYLYHYYQSNILSILALTTDLNADLYMSSYFDSTFRSKPDYTNMYYARDGHPSTWVQNGIFKMFKHKVDNNEVSNIQYIKENLQTRDQDGDEPVMDNNEQGVLQSPPFTGPNFATIGYKPTPEELIITPPTRYKIKIL